MATRPDEKPRWATVPTVNGTTGKNNVIEPTEGKKNLGWDYKEKPARNFLNWLHNKTYEWIDYFDTRPFVLKENTVPDMNVIIGAGSFRVRGLTLTELTEQTLGPITAPVTNPRLDRVVLNTVTSIIEIVTGAEAPSPVVPAVSIDQIPIARIGLSPGTTEILNGNISEEKMYVDSVKVGTTTEAGVNELATNAEAVAKADGSVVVTALNLNFLDATQTFKGMIEISDDTEMLAKVDGFKALSPLNLAALGSTETITGLIKKANLTEARSGTNDIGAMTSLKTETYYKNHPRGIRLFGFEKATTVAGGGSAVGWQLIDLNADYKSSGFGTLNLGTDRLDLPEGRYDIDIQYGGLPSGADYKLKMVDQGGPTDLEFGVVCPGGGLCTLQTDISISFGNNIVLEFYLYSSAAIAVNGLGVPVGDGSPEIYCSIKVKQRSSDATV